MYPKSLQKVIDNLTKLPGIGPKSAERIAHFILRMDENEINDLIESIEVLRNKIKYCKICFNITEGEDICHICSNPVRDKTIVLVVEEIKDLIRIESLGYYNGVYHVLGGHISTSGKIGIHDLTINELEERVKSGNIKEVIFALSPQWEGDMTKEYIKKILKKYKIKLTSLARGISGSTYLEAIDDSSLLQALQDRKEES
ncbi:MAG: recombination mediator RecR [Caldisericia bacterium]